MHLGLGLGLTMSRRRRGAGSDEDEMPRKYLFIDGGFLQRFEEDMREKIEPEFQSASLNMAIVGSGFDRVFYYDAYPEKKSNQSDEEFEQISEQTEKHFDMISRTRNFSVRPALTKGGRRQQQKGVDVLLAIECLSHAVRNNIDEATIMTSDLDFYPLFEALLQTKTKSVLRYQIGHTSKELVRAADYSEPITLTDFITWQGTKYQNYSNNRSISQSILNERGEPVGSGSVDGKKYELWRVEHNGDFFYTPLVDGTVVISANRNRLYLEGLVEKKYCSQIKYDE